ncbi:TBL3 [Bugula neritina]|uniref:TBL3 n=1 Tax=Bugula neritina TaxID=10212 RepID=A0A7J7KMT6_BUGNE|nr:TBL3 [Bugula neritina]
MVIYFRYMRSCSSMLHQSTKKIPKESYEVEFKQTAFYTGGKIHVTSDGSYLLTTCRNAVKIIDMDTGLVVSTIEEDDDPAVTCFCVTPDDESLVVASENRLLKLWDWKNNTVTRSWKSIHDGPILEMTIEQTSTLLASGSSDKSIKIWDIDRKYWTHNLKGHTGVITAVKFHPEGVWLLSAALDLHIRVWNLQNSECLACLEGHFSAITDILIDPLHTDVVISSGRDKVLLVWDIKQKEKLNTIPVYEAVESIIPLERCVNSDIGVKSKDDLHVVTAGSKGALRVWNCATRLCVHTQKLPESLTDAAADDSETALHSITQAFAVKSRDQICTSNHEHNIQFYSSETLHLEKQYIGNNEEIMDVQLFGSNEEYLALATNSVTVKVYSLADFDSDCLYGHTDLVTTLSVSTDGHLLLSGSKDNTAILWNLGENIHDMHKIYRATGHAQSVSSVCLTRLSCSAMLTGSVDNTLKLWKGPTDDLTDSPEQIYCAQTVLAHDRDINSVDMSPNDRLVLTGSRDKTAKIWRADDLSLVGILKGHTRGIWKAKFSPVDQCAITASADGTLKMFDISSFTCIKTFEGHESPVLNVCFVTRGMQFVSSDDDGLVRLWNIKDTELVKTFEGHSERCWALTVCKHTQNRMVSGCANATIVVWKDVTETNIIKNREIQEKSLLNQQELSNLMHEKRFHEALSLALTMEKPFHTLTIVKEILSEETEDVLLETVSKLDLTQIDVLLRFCVEWNTNSKTCHEAQLLLKRHYQRMSKLVQQTQFIDYTFQCMRLGEKTSPNSTA